MSFRLQAYRNTRTLKKLYLQNYAKGRVRGEYNFMFKNCVYACRSTLIYLQSAKQSWFVLVCGYFLLYYKSPIISDGMNTSLYSIFSLITSLHTFSFKDSVTFDFVWSSVMFIVLWVGMIKRILVVYGTGPTHHHIYSSLLEQWLRYQQ